MWLKELAEARVCGDGYDKAIIFAEGNPKFYIEGDVRITLAEKARGVVPHVRLEEGTIRHDLKFGSVTELTKPSQRISPENIKVFCEKDLLTLEETINRRLKSSEKPIRIAQLDGIGGIDCLMYGILHIQAKPKEDALILNCQLDSKGSIYYKKDDRFSPSRRDNVMLPISDCEFLLSHQQFTNYKKQLEQTENLKKFWKIFK